MGEASFVVITDFESCQFTVVLVPLKVTSLSTSDEIIAPITAVSHRNLLVCVCTCGKMCWLFFRESPKYNAIVPGLETALHPAQGHFVFGVTSSRQGK